MIKKMNESVKKRFPRAWGLFYRVYRGGRALFWKVYYFFKMKKKGCFVFQGIKLPYLGHAYNNADANERAVEIPIIRGIVGKYRPEEVLEIGNVFSHYYAAPWDIVDKFEKGVNVINEDIVSFKPLKKYRLVISISTFEHIGYDESVFRDLSEGHSLGKIPEDGGKTAEAINSVIGNCLSSDGLFVITVPLGHNALLDEMILSGNIAFGNIYFLKRISSDNKWEQCGREDVIGVKYGRPFRFANAIAVCATRGLYHEKP